MGAGHRHYGSWMIHLLPGQTADAIILKAWGGRWFAQVKHSALYTIFGFLCFVHKTVDDAFYEKIINIRINAGYSGVMA
jgi:hypothetical protein